VGQHQRAMGKGPPDTQCLLPHAQRGWRWITIIGLQH
jgi:hypothetical protein